jgi:hypothetical protein
VNKRLYMCQSCFSYYDNRKRAKRCHEGLIVAYDVVLSKRIGCDSGFKHLYTDKLTGKRINNCFYCGKVKSNAKH